MKNLILTYFFLKDSDNPDVHKFGIKFFWVFSFWFICFTLLCKSNRDNSSQENSLIGIESSRIWLICMKDGWKIRQMLIQGLFCKYSSVSLHFIKFLSSVKEVTRKIKPAFCMVSVWILRCSVYLYICIKFFYLFYTNIYDNIITILRNKTSIFDESILGKHFPLSAA